MSARILNIDRTPRKERRPSMLIVDLTSGRQLGIAFKHSSYTPGPLAPMRRMTSCTLYDVRGEDVAILAEGEARCNFKDNFSKEGGRKRSLRKALKVLDPGENRDRDMRQAVWDTYFSRLVKVGG